MPLLFERILFGECAPGGTIVLQTSAKIVKVKFAILGLQVNDRDSHASHFEGSPVNVQQLTKGFR